jgi:nitrate/TMAO reductase-like tetraheme cytochrome c subunit
MTEKSTPKKQNKFPFLTVVIAVVALGVIFTAGGFTFAATQEQHDSFCASCHTQPESTFYLRSTAAQPTDMASFHTAQKVNCIDCHSGVGLNGRVQAELMGAHNALLWYTGTAIQPAVQTTPISDQNCLKCHQDVVQRGFVSKEQITIPGGSGGREREGRNGHWHQFLTRWQAASATAGTCTSCHGGHPTEGTAQSGFMVDQVVQQQCEACHQAIRREDG